MHYISTLHFNFDPSANRVRYCDATFELKKCLFLQSYSGQLL